ncbi:hypothetical protein RRG08_013449 [Elysia crispata]|uniref:Major facilitator superfamily (MFS) profile domain-containing protein n=1 Tax=Elysia crispata TaxID=231223 RepID=A0AAE1B7K6_9GAST|nr:hypothetical protein RRG08_013449 [Elysia crispata]
MPYRTTSKWRGVLVVAGGILVHLSLGTLYTFGNLNPYLTSYMRWTGTAPDLKNTECTWVFAAAAMGQGLVMSLGGVIQSKLGPRLTCLLGSWWMSFGVLMTYFTIEYSFYLTVLTYGLVFGSGVGIAYSMPLSCGMRWFPERKGLVNGLVVAGFGGGAFIFNQVQTAFINPNNLAAEKEVGDESYFDQPEVLHEVRKVFLLLGCCYLFMQLIGSLLICDPPYEQDVAVNETMTDEEQTALQNYSKKGASAALLPSQSEERNPLCKGDDVVNLRPFEMLRSKYFYMLWFIFLLNGQGIVFISTLYKAYGQTFIEDDSFLAVVGSFAAIFNAGGRIWWGFLADKTSFRVSMMLACACFTCLILTFQVTELQGRETFFLWVCLLFGSFSGSYSLLPTATAKCFGREYVSMNYGLVFTSQVISAPLGAFLSQQLISEIGWPGLCFMVSSFTFTSMMLAIFFTAKDRHGKEI